MVLEWLEKWVPDEPKESDTEYDGFLSYAKEWHAATTGTGAGTLSAALWLTGKPVSSVLILGALVTVALGIERKARRVGIKVPEFQSKAARSDIRNEPWYAIGFGLVTFSFLVLVVKFVL